MKTSVALLLNFALVVLFSHVSVAQTYSIDISGLHGEEYNPGEEIIFTVLLLDGEDFASGKVTVQLSDVLGKKTITRTVDANTEVRIPVENDFVGGLWVITAMYEGVDVERSFLVGERSGVDFIIDGDELVIQNNGNVRYTRTVQITIGTHTESYLQNIGVGDEKRLKLVSPTGTYDIVVTDGKTTLKRQNIELIGTGNVIGAVDRELVGYTGFAGANEVAEANDRQVSLSKLPLSLTFIAAVFILGILVFAERHMSRKRKRR